MRHRDGGVLEYDPSRWRSVMGLALDMPISKMWRDSRSFMITEGPVEVMRMVLARELLRGL